MADDPKLVLLKWHTDVAHLRELLHQEGWDKYTLYVDRVINEQIEQLLNTPPGMPQGMTDFQRGVITGLRRAVQIPHEIIKNVEVARAN